MGIEWAITTAMVKYLTYEFFPTITTRFIGMKATRRSPTSVFALNRTLTIRFWVGERLLDYDKTGCSTFSWPNGHVFRELIYRTGAQPGRSARYYCAIWMDRNSRRRLRQGAASQSL